jgi:hypothetical protein
MAGRTGQFGGDPRAELRVRVQPGADRRAAERQLAQVRPRRAQMPDAVIDLRDPARDLLAERQRGRVLQMGAADLDDAGKSPGFLLQRLLDSRSSCRGICGSS